MAKSNKVLLNIDQSSDTSAEEKARARNNIGAVAGSEVPDLFVWRWHDTTPQWTTVGADEIVRIWYSKNYHVNNASIELNSSHSSICYIDVTLPELNADETYKLSFEIDIRAVGADYSSASVVIRIDSETSGFTLLPEYDTDGNVPLNRLQLPAQGATVKHKVYVDGHAFRVARLA